MQSKTQLQKSIISYVPKNKRQKGASKKASSDNFEDIDIIEQDENRENDEDEIDQALLCDEKRKKYIKTHFSYIGYVNNHSMYQCKEMKFEDGIAYACTYKERDSRLDFYHVHRWEKIDNADKTPEQKKSISEYELLLKKIAILAGHYNLSFSVIESDQFWDILQSVFVYGQQKQDSKVEFFIQKPSHQKMRQTFINTAKEYHETQLIAFSRIPYVSMTLDAGTLTYGHFLDHAISTPYYNITPYLYEADFCCNNSSDYIKTKTKQIILDLFQNKIKIGTITGDNYPAQLYALSNWSKTALWKETDDKIVKSCIYFSCFCHTLQLIAEDVEDHVVIEKSMSILNSMKNFINDRLSKEVGVVPSEVETRWFSIMNSLKFLLTKKAKIIEVCDDLLIQDSVSEKDKQSLSDIFNESNFEIIYKYALTMVPIYSATLFFNSNNSKASEIVPIAIQIREYWEKLLKDEEFEEFHNVIEILLERLKHRLFHLQDLPLLYFIYSLTPGGRIFARKMLKKYE